MIYVLVPLAIFGGLVLLIGVCAWLATRDDTVCIGEKAGVPIYGRGADMKALRRLAKRSPRGAR
jgi:hypothetical protein